VTTIFKPSAGDSDSGPNLPLPGSTSISRWAFINDSKVEPQSDDREPMFGAVAFTAASPSAGRSRARRKHQAMYKEWSQGRHE
jgi:hypothetical protein